MQLLHSLTTLQELNIEVERTEEETVLWSKWIEPQRELNGQGGCTWWGNGNHLQLGTPAFSPATADALAWRWRVNGTERPATTYEVYSIAWAHWTEATFFSWQCGDILVFNNQTVSHDATPGLGKRAVLPSFGGCFQPHTKAVTGDQWPVTSDQ